MTNMRIKRTSEFKTEVALAAIRGDQTVTELVSLYKVHPNQITTWKRQAQDQLVATFDNKKAKSLTIIDMELIIFLIAVVAICFVAGLVAGFRKMRPIVSDPVRCAAYTKKRADARARKQAAFDTELREQGWI